MPIANRRRAASPEANQSFISRNATPARLCLLLALFAASLIYLAIWSWRPSAKPPTDAQGVRAWVLAQLAENFAKDPVKEGEVPNHVDAIEFRGSAQDHAASTVYEFDGIIMGQGKNGKAQIGTVSGRYDINQQKLDADLHIGKDARHVEATFGK